MPQAPLRPVLIPVIDLKGGQAVHARGGRRDDYRPIRSPLCPSSHPPLVAAALLAAAEAHTLYVADLDAIEGREAQIDLIREINAECGEIDLWIDAAIRNAVDCRTWMEHGCRPIIGSETLVQINGLKTLVADLPGLVLSLDFDAAGFRGPAGLAQDASLWPERVIVMSLDRVGSGSGPDVERLRAVSARADGRQVFAAGGVRSADDLAVLAEMGVAGALVGSALHAGTLP